MQKTGVISSIMISLVLASFLSMTNANGFVDASCHVTVQVFPYPSMISINGTKFTRQNPDGTYYPGDAFDFAILVSWTQNCWQIMPGTASTSFLTLITSGKMRDLEQSMHTRIQARTFR